MQAPQATQPRMVDSDSRSRVNVQRIGLDQLRKFRGSGKSAMRPENWARFLRNNTTFPVPTWHLENGRLIWTVASVTTEGQSYEVEQLRDGSWVCTCKASVTCTHIYLARHESLFPATWPTEAALNEAAADIERVLAENPNRGRDTEVIPELGSLDAFRDWKAGKGAYA